MIAAEALKSGPSPKVFHAYGALKVLGAAFHPSKALNFAYLKRRETLAYVASVISEF